MIMADVFQPLSPRYEFKYDLSQQQIDKLLNLYKPFISFEETYRVNSLYLDSPDRVSVAEKLNGEQAKVKFRFRHYNDNLEQAYFEIKKKDNERVQKSRISVSPHGQMPEAVRALITLRGLRPVCWVRYQRDVYKLRITAGHFVRLTVDSDINCQRVKVDDWFNVNQQVNYQLLTHKGFILELKPTELNSGLLKEFMQLYQGSKVSISKYAMAYQKLSEV